MQMIHPLTHGLVLWPAPQEDTKSGVSIWIHSFPEQEKLCQMFATSELHWEFIE